MLRIVASTLPALRPLLRRRPLLNPKALLRSRLPPRPFCAISSSALPAAAGAPRVEGAGEAVAVEEHLTRCAAADRAPLRVAVLVSGGVDSSVALRLLHAAGHRCTAFYLKIWFQVRA
jgi:tRNA-specific 2-thiouridylase